MFVCRLISIMSTICLCGVTCIVWHIFEDKHHNLTRHRYPIRPLFPPLATWRPRTFRSTLLGAVRVTPSKDRHRSVSRELRSGSASSEATVNAGYSTPEHESVQGQSTQEHPLDGQKGQRRAEVLQGQRNMHSEQLGVLWSTFWPGR